MAASRWAWSAASVPGGSNTCLAFSARGSRSRRQKVRELKSSLNPESPRRALRPVADSPGSDAWVLWLIPEQQLGQQVQVVLPDRPGVAAGIDVPDVRHLLFLQEAVQPLADVHQPVGVAA